MNIKTKKVAKSLTLIMGSCLAPFVNTVWAATDTPSSAAQLSTNPKKVVQNNAVQSSVNKQKVDEHLIVTANRTPQAQFDSLASSQIISKDDIALMQATNIAELLDTVAGISIASQGGSGQLQSVYTRGSNANHTLILIDGIRVNSATLGYTDISTIATSLIERIEVVKGPRAALWGSDAIGGVIQIFTKQYQAGAGVLNIALGSHQLRTANAAIGLGDDKQGITVAIHGEQSRGFNIYQTDPLPYDIDEPDTDGYDKLSASINAHQQLNDDWQLSLISRLETGNNEYDASYPSLPCWDDMNSVCPLYFANQQTHDNYTVKVAANYQKAETVTNISYSQAKDDVTNFGNGIPKKQGSALTTKRQQVNLVHQRPLLLNWQLVFGAEHYQESISSEQQSPQVTNWQMDQRQVSAGFLQVQTDSDSWLASAAIRYDDIQHIDEETTHSVNLGYRLSKNTLLAVSHSTGFKAPSFNDLYWPGSGNPNLISEVADSHELLLRHRFDTHKFNGQVEAVYFATHIDNLIAWAPNDVGLWQPDNINQADIVGYEVAVDVHSESLSHQLTMALIDSSDATTSEPLLRRPKKTASYQLHHHGQTLSTHLSIHYHGESEDVSKTLDAYVKVDLAMRYPITDDITFNAKLNNLFNKTHQTAEHYVADGRNYTLSLHYTF